MMSYFLYGSGFILIYEVVVMCNKAIRGPVFDRPFNPTLLFIIYGISVSVFISVLLAGLIHFQWWFPTTLLVVGAPLISVIILRWIKSAAIVVQATVYLLFGVAASVCALIPMP
jgi:hypothetical protein